MGLKEIPEKTGNLETIYIFKGEKVCYEQYSCYPVIDAGIRRIHG